MSEYQYYEFQAIDRPLTDGEMQALRACSSRAEITPTSFVNEYHWGSFKGDAEQWMDEYFDAHLYVANWGARELTLRLPCRLLPLEIARRYVQDEGNSARATSEHVIVTFVPDDGEDGFEGGWDETSGASGWLASLLPLRADIAGGDYRALYLAWLRSIQGVEDVSDDVVEPPAPAGLADLNGALRRLVDFLRIDEDLIAVAAEGSPPMEESITPAALAAWVAAMPESEKTGLLVRIATGEEPLPKAAVLRHFRATGDDRPPRRPRRVADLLAAAEAHRAERQRREAERAAQERARLEREAAAARNRRLDELARDEAAAWHRVDSLIATKHPGRYDDAVALLLDLRDLAARSSRASEFAGRFRSLEADHSRKPSLLDRFRRAGLGVGGSGP